MALAEGYVAYVHKYRRAAIGVIQPTRAFHGPHETYDPGFTAQFKGHLFVTNDPKIIKAMDNHHRYGATFQRVKSGRDYELIKQYGSSPVRMMRGPATTMAEKLGAPKPLPPDVTRIDTIAPPPEEPASAKTPPSKRAGRGK